MAIGSRRKKIESVKNDQYAITAADILIPAFSAVIFVLLLIFVYIPRVSDILEIDSEIRDVVERQKAIQTNIDKVEALNSNSTQLTQDLNTVKYVIPTSLEVANFAYYIDQIALKSGLILVEISSGDIDIQQIKEQQFPSGVLKGVSGPLTYQGKYSQIVEFLNVLKAESPYIVETAEIDLSRNVEASNADEWKLELALTGFYMSELKDFKLDMTRPLVPYTNNIETMLLFQEKSLKIKPSANQSDTQEN